MTFTPTTPAKTDLTPAAADELLFAGQRARLYRDGATGYDIVRVGHGVGAVVVARRTHGPYVQFALVKQWRHALRETTWEFPRGGADAMEDAATAARRELAEETGYAVPAHSIQLLGQVTPDTGILDSRAAVFLADLTGTTPRALEAETDDLMWVGRDELLTMIKDGAITCGFTLAAYALYTAIVRADKVALHQ